MGLEEDLQNLFKFTGAGTKDDVGGMLNHLIINTQLNTLRQMRKMIDEQLKLLGAQIGTEQGKKDVSAYDVLGVAPTATREEIDKAFHKKARVAHPDRGGTHEQMVLVNAAYEAIRQLRGWTK